MAARFWVGGSGDWSDTTHWSAASGGAGGASVPTISDSATFNSASATAGTALVVTGSGDVGQLNAAPPTSGSLSFNGSYINIEPLAGTTSTISAGVTLPGSLYFGSYSVGTQTLSISSTTSTSTDILIYGRVGSTPVVSGTMNIRSLRVYGDYFGSGVSSVTFSSANITATNSILVDDGPYPLTNVTLTSSTFNSETVRFQGNATYTGSGNTLRTPSTGFYNTVNWYYPPSVVFPGSIIAVSVNGTSANNVFPSGTITVTDSPYFVYTHSGSTPPRAGAVTLTRSNFYVNNMGTFPCGAVTLTSDATTGSSLIVNNGYTDCGTVSAVAPATVPHYIYGGILSSGTVTLTNCTYDSGNASFSGITVSGLNSISVSSSAPATYSFTGTIYAGTGLVSFSNVYPILTNTINTTGTVNINNSAAPASSNNYIYGSSGYEYKFASGTWTDISIQASYISVQTTGAFTISQAATLISPVVNFGLGTTNTIIGGAFSVTTPGSVSIQSNNNVTFSNTAAFINTGWSASNSNWIVSAGSSNTLTHTGALTVTGARINASGGTVLYSSTITINSNTTGGYGYYNTGYYSSGSFTANGVITLNAGTLSGVSPGGNTFYIAQLFNNISLVSINSTGLSNATPNNVSAYASSSGYVMSFSGSSTLTDTVVSVDAVWKNTGAATLTVSGAAGNNTPLTFDPDGLWMATGAASFTNTNVTIYGQFDDGTGNYFGLKSGAAVTVTGATTTSSGVEFSTSYAVSFVAATLVTWTDVKISIGNFFGNTTFNIGGAGGFTLAGAAKNSEIASPYCAMSVTGPTSLTVGALGAKDITLYSLSAGGTLGVTGLGSGSVFSLGYTGLSTSVTGAATFNNIDLSIAGGSIFVSTFNWTSTALNLNSIAMSTSASQTSQFNTTATITNVSQCSFYLVIAQAFNVTGLGSGSTFTINDTASTNTFGGAASFTNISCTTYNASTFTSTFGWTSTVANANAILMGVFGGTTTFTGAATIANCVSIDFSGPVGCGANLSVSSTALLDAKTSTAIFRNNLNVSAAATTTFTNVRAYLAGTNSLGLVTLATNGGIYLGFTTTTISGALSSSGASTFFPIEGESGSVLVLNGAVTLVNTSLRVPTITVAGGATKNFAYSLLTPIPDDRGNNGTLGFSYSYPEIAFDTFTLTNTGGTFSVTGGGAINLRTFIRPFSTVLSSVAMNIAVNPTFTDVDFWRVVPGGASTKPWTGTRLGNVGTLTNITTDTPKNTWWVGGGGSWGAAKWATSSGGAASINNYPLPQDTVIFDNASGGGNVTLPASVRFKNLSVQVAPSTATAIYSTAPNVPGLATYMFMSGSFTGPLISGGPFIFGNDSAYNFNYDNFINTSQINLIVADSSSSDTHTISPQNLQFMPKGGLLFANLGTLQITEDIKNTSGYELAQIASYTNDTASRVVNFTCSNVGRNLSSTDWTSSSSRYDFSNGTFNLGGCVFGAANFSSSSSTIANTPYTVIASNSVAMTNATTSTAGNVIAIFNTGGAPNSVFISVNNTSTYQNISTVGASSTSFIYFSGSSTFNCYNFSVDGPLSLRSLNANKSIVKVGGGKISLAGVKVTASGFRLDASPANTWYVPSGTVGSGSTGWTIASVATNTGSFIFF